MAKALILSEKDNVAVLLEDVKEGEEIEARMNEFSKKVVSRGNIPFGHKVALRTIGKGQPIIKYGEVIGVAIKEISEGSHVHVHNVASTIGKRKRVGSTN